MKLGRETLINTVAMLAVAACAAWVVHRTEWVDETVNSPATGEAARDMHYAIKKIVQRLGATVVSPHNLDRMPPASATLVLGSWDWDIFPERQPALKKWVESGGHLWTAATKRPTWVPVEESFVPTAPTGRKPPAAPFRASPSPSGGSFLPPRLTFCHSVVEHSSIDALDAFSAVNSADTPLLDTIAPPPKRQLCSAAGNRLLKAYAPVHWSIDGDLGHEVLQVAVGHGSVTVALDAFSSNERVFDGDNAALFIDSLHLQPGSTLWFVDTEERLPLLAQMWKSGAPAMLLAGLLLAGLLWRTGTRFGPLAAPPVPARRSVTEQIRGTAQFLLRNDGTALHRAELRALEAAARRRVQGHDRLDRRTRAEAIAKITAIDADALARAMDTSLRRPRRDLLATLALLEAAARRLSP